MKKIALVTGGSRGLGENTALSLAQKGIDVILTYLSNKEKAEEVVIQIKSMGQAAVALPLDVSKPKSFDDFIKKFETELKENFDSEKFDFLINNAGIGIHAPFSETTEEQFDLLMNIHIKAPFFLTQKILRLINDGGSIINISSGLARFSLPGYDAYAIMKSGAEVMTRYLAKTLGQKGIKVNIVAPGAIETDFGGGAVRDNAEINGFIASQTALGRVGLPDDIGGVIAFLCSQEAKWITGQRIEVSGGMFL